jgi:hypothetical protein
LVMLNGKSGEILKGLAPNISQKVKAGKHIYVLCDASYAEPLRIF